MTWLYVPNCDASPSALASEVSISDCALPSERLAQSVSWRGKLQQPPAWSRLWKRGGFIRLLSGLTLEPSMQQHGVEQWIASCRAIPAKGTALPESGSVSSTTDGCSIGPSRYSIKAGLMCSSARTSRGISTDNSLLRSRHWSDWGAALRAEYSARPRPERAIGGSGFSCWPTVRTSDTNGAGKHGDGGADLRTLASQWETPSVAVTAGTRLTRGGDRSEELLLSGQATAATERWSTPRATDGEKGGPNQNFGAGGTPLPAQAAHWMTPRTVQGAYTRDGGDPEKERLTLEGQAQTWATPTARMHKGGGSAVTRADGKSRLDMLDWQAESWPTPMAGSSGTDTYNAAGNSDFSRKAEELAKAVRAFATTDLSLPDRPTPSGEKSSETRRRLNPLFVEWLMGWPEGLSGFDTAEMASCLSPRPSPGCGCMDCWLTTQRAMLDELLAIEEQGRLL